MKEKDALIQSYAARTHELQLHIEKLSETLAKRGALSEDEVLFIELTNDEVSINYFD